MSGARLGVRGWILSGMAIFQQLSEFVVGGCGERAFKINRLADNAVAMSGWAAK